MNDLRYQDLVKQARLIAHKEGLVAPRVFDALDLKMEAEDIYKYELPSEFGGGPGYVLTSTKASDRESTGINTKYWNTLGKIDSGIIKDRQQLYADMRRTISLARSRHPTPAPTTVPTPGRIKTATVRGPIKQYRRALEMMLGRTHAFHGTRDTAGILGSRSVKPGSMNLHGQGTVQESYWTKGLPELRYSFDTPTFAVPNRSVLRSHGRELAMPPTEARKWGWDADSWLLAQKDVPLRPKNVFIAGASTTPAEIAAARESLLRVIGPKEFWGANLRATGSLEVAEGMEEAGLKSLRGLLNKTTGTRVKTSAVTPERVHEIAKALGIPNDSTRNGLKAISTRVTGKAHLDDMTPAETSRLAKSLVTSYEMGKVDRIRALKRWGLDKAG